MPREFKELTTNYMYTVQWTYFSLQARYNTVTVYDFDKGMELISQLLSLY